jgi:3-isopropylmalate/(R)-2-methylmalate dehydratase large subunit
MPTPKPQTFVQKILAKASGNDSVNVGDIIDVRADVMFSHDNSAAIMKLFQQIGAEKIAYPERVTITLDHAVPAPTTLHAQNHAEIRAWVQAQHIQHFFEVGRGICHQVISEEALVLPGETIFGSDSHSTHFGWLGAFGMGVGRSEMAALWATGELWMSVPDSMKITLNGKLPLGVTAKDIALKILGDNGVDGGQYRAIEFHGDTLGTLSIDERPVLPNMMAEFGAMSAYVPPDESVFAYLEAKRTRAYTPLYPDDGAHYAQEYILDVSQLEAQIALPHQPDNVRGLSQVLGQPIQQAFVGTCTGGRYEDLEAVATVVKGHTLKSRLIVIPSSSEVLKKALQTGVLAILLEAGVAINTPGCGPCMGNHMGVPAPNEATISTGSRNFKGRMGTPEAPCYLANPFVTAACAVAGYIIDPREVIRP